MRLDCCWSTTVVMPKLPRLPDVRELDADYAKIVAKLLRDLDDAWPVIFPKPDRAERKRKRSVEEIMEELSELPFRVLFRPFTDFGARLYDVYAERMLGTGIELVAFERLLNDDLKTHICEMIAPLPPSPFPDRSAKAHAARQQHAIGEWQMRIGQSWRRFRLPTDNRTDQRVRREIIEALESHPEKQSEFITRLHQELTKRVPDWFSRAMSQSESRAISVYTSDPAEDKLSAIGSSEPVAYAFDKTPADHVGKDSLRKEPSKLTKHERRGVTSPKKASPHATSSGRNIDRLRKLCGWTYDALSAKLGIDKKNIIGHVKHGVKPSFKTLQMYADAFTKAGHQISATELQRRPNSNTARKTTKRPPSAT